MLHYRLALNAGNLPDTLYTPMVFLALKQYSQPTKQGVFSISGVMKWASALNIDSSTATTPKFPTQITWTTCIKRLQCMKSALISVSLFFDHREHILSWFFKMVNSVEEVMPCHLHISLFDNPPTSYSCIISHSVIRSISVWFQHFHFSVINRPKHCFNFSNSKHDHKEMFHSCSPSKWHNKTTTSYTQKTDHGT